MHDALVLDRPADLGGHSSDLVEDPTDETQPENTDATSASDARRSRSEKSTVREHQTTTTIVVEPDAAQLALSRMAAACSEGLWTPGTVARNGQHCAVGLIARFLTN